MADSEISEIFRKQALEARNFSYSYNDGPKIPNLFVIVGLWTAGFALLGYVLLFHPIEVKTSFSVSHEAIVERLTQKESGDYLYEISVSDSIALGPDAPRDICVLEHKLLMSWESCTPAAIIAIDHASKPIRITIRVSSALNLNTRNWFVVGNPETITLSNLIKLDKA